MKRKNILKGIAEGEQFIVKRGASGRVGTLEPIEGKTSWWLFTGAAEEVMQEGGKYWSGVVRSAEVIETVSQRDARLIALKESAQAAAEAARVKAERQKEVQNMCVVHAQGRINANSHYAVDRRAKWAQDALKKRQEAMVNMAFADDFADATVALALAEGYAHTMALISKTLAEGGWPAVSVALIHELSRRADDTYSGRGNDVRRAHADGVRRAANEVSYQLQDGLMQLLEEHLR